MTPKPFQLRQRLFLLLLGVGGLGVAALLWTLLLAYDRLFNHVIPEHRGLHQIETASVALVNRYASYMADPDPNSRAAIDRALTRVRGQLDEYIAMVADHRHELADSPKIRASLDTLGGAGQSMLVARIEFEKVFARQAALEDTIEEVFATYLDQVSSELGTSIEAGNLDQLTRHNIPELRMIKSINQQMLQLFLEIREYQNTSEDKSFDEMTRLQQQIGFSNTMLEMFIENSTPKAESAAGVVGVFDALNASLAEFIAAKDRVDAATVNVERAGVMLAGTINAAIEETETAGWDDLRQSLLMSAGILLATLLASYLLLFAGATRLLAPLFQLQQAIKRFGEGAMAQRAPVLRADEIGSLAGAFNTMADELERNAARQHELIEQLEHKNAELERFTYTVSHELKTPLVTVSGFIGLLERDIADGDRAQIRADIERIQHAVETMSGQLEDLLELSRVGRIVNPAQRFSVSDLCHEVLPMIEGPIGQSSARIEIEPAMPAVAADRLRVGEVVRNLVENAIKFHGGAGVPEIEIDADLDGDRVEIRICDNGPGIEPQFREKVFELFDRLDDSVPGTGIGLALARRIVELHGGRIWIETPKNGQGSCFCFTLPAAAGEES